MRRGVLILIGIVGIITLGFIILYLLGGKQPPNVNAVTLEWWGVFDEQSSYTEVIALYKQRHPYVTINYKKLRLEEYEQALLEGWARGNGPDIFALPNSWIGKYDAGGFLTPLPATTRMAFFTMTRPLGVREELKIEYRNVNSLTPTEIDNRYVSVVGDDVVRNNAIVALPQSMDTLVMYYNKDLFNFAVVTQPPSTWSDFIEIVPKLTILDAANKVVQAGAALGTSQNIPRDFDILSVLMMQNGAQMVDSVGRPSFQSASVTDPAFFPGQEALRFYTDFATPTKQVYTWDADMTDALEAFIAGKTAIFFGYQYHRDILDAQSSKLNWSVAAIPQVDPVRPISYANYWTQSVAKSSEHSNEAWNFIQFLSHPEVVVNYLNASGKTPAVTSLVQQDLENPDPVISVFAKQAITAKSWYHGKDPIEAEAAFDEMIDNALLGTQTLPDIMSLGSRRVQRTY